MWGCTCDKGLLAQHSARAQVRFCDCPCRLSLAPTDLDRPSTPPRCAQGTVHDHDVLVKRLRHLLGDLTFMEAFQHTGALRWCLGV